MFKLSYKHKELKKLSWSVKAFNRLLANEEVKESSYKLVLTILGFINITLNE